MVTPHHPRRTIGATLVLACMAVAVGCEAPDPEMEPVDEAEPVTEAPPTTIPLEPVEESGVFGEASTVRSPEEFLVVLQVSGLPAEGEYPAHIHQGSCEEGGPVAAPLNPVLSVAEDGTGTSTTAVAEDDLDNDGAYFLQVHGTDGAPIACGDVDLTPDA